MVSLVFPENHLIRNGPVHGVPISDQMPNTEQNWTFLKSVQSLSTRFEIFLKSSFLHFEKKSDEFSKIEPINRCMLNSSTNKTTRGSGFLPARMRPEQTADYLGFTTDEIRILINQGLLKPLGKPRSNAVKYFAFDDVQALGRDLKWLDKATAAVQSFWHEKNKRKQNKPVTAAA